MPIPVPQRPVADIFLIIIALLFYYYIINVDKFQEYFLYSLCYYFGIRTDAGNGEI